MAHTIQTVAVITENEGPSITEPLNLPATWVHIFKTIVEELEAQDINNYFSTSIETVLKFDKDQMRNYIEAIKIPMDFQTIRRKFDGAAEIYYNDPWDVIEDIYQIFDNAINFQGSKDTVRDAKKLLLICEDLLSNQMKGLGYCCSRLQHKVLFCHAKKLNRCIIKFGKTYFIHKSMVICENCYPELKDTIIHPITNKRLYKSGFEATINTRPELEPFVKCKACNKRLHKYCVAYDARVWPEGYTCTVCLKKNLSKPSHKYLVKNIKHTSLSRWLEQRVKLYIATKKADAEVIGDVSIRVLSSGTCNIEIKEAITNTYPEFQFQSFPYRAKAIFAFQAIDGEEVCFFGMHVQECGTDECPLPLPNRRSVYLAYIDSVNHFVPRNWKTDVYYQIILGYMEFAKVSGFEKVYIWACPPQTPDTDFIFRCHPADQKTPTATRLQKWYNTLVKKSVEEGIVQSYTNISDVFNELSTITDFPFFHEDLLDLVLDSVMEQEKAKQAQNSSVRLSKSRYKRTPVDQPNPAVSESDNSMTVVLAPSVLLLRVKQILKGYKRSFFILTLQSQEDANRIVLNTEKTETRCELVESRDQFLFFSKINNLEFSTLAKAKYSTLFFITEICQRYPDLLTPLCEVSEKIVDSVLVEYPGFGLCTCCVKIQPSIMETNSI